MQSPSLTYRKSTMANAMSKNPAMGRDMFETVASGNTLGASGLDALASSSNKGLSNAKAQGIAEMLGLKKQGEASGYYGEPLDVSNDMLEMPASAKLRSLKRGRQKLTPEMLELLMSL